MSRDEAVAVLAKWMAPNLSASATLEQDWQNWLRTLFGRWTSDRSGNPIPFAAHHHTMWEWCWKIRLGVKQEPLIAILPRGGAKSTTVELMVAAVAARRTRSYGLYICATQPQSDDHVQNVGALLESAEFAKYYPAAANKRVNKYGYSSGWNRQRLRTASGFTLDSIGLDTAARGVKLEETRPDLIILDDIDGKLDTLETTEKKISLITTTFLPAGSTDSVVVGVQNLVIEDGVFARLANVDTITKKADFLQNRIMIGPLPAIEDAQVVVPTEGPRAGKYTIVGGTPVWEGQNLAKAQADIDEWGYTAWKTEAQQEVGASTSGLFSSIDFDAITITEAEFTEQVINNAGLVDTVVWCDPAVTNSDRSDSHGVQADSLGTDGILYRRRSWEGKETPEQVIKRAMMWGIELQASHIGIETDQGGDLWEVAFNKVWDDLLEGKVGEKWEQAIVKAWNDKLGRFPFYAEKAGAGFGSKAHRGSLMLRDYEGGKIRHIADQSNSHNVLKRALGRAFVKKPFDLADAAFWGWNDLLGSLSGGIGASDDTPLTPYGTRVNSALGQKLHGNDADIAWRAGSDRLRIGRLWQGHTPDRVAPVQARPWNVF